MRCLPDAMVGGRDGDHRRRTGPFVGDSLRVTVPKIRIYDHPVRAIVLTAIERIIRGESIAAGTEFEYYDRFQLTRHNSAVAEQPRRQAGARTDHEYRHLPEHPGIAPDHPDHGAHRRPPSSKDCPRRTSGLPYGTGDELTSRSKTTDGHQPPVCQFVERNG